MAKTTTYYGIDLHEGQKRILQEINTNPLAKFITIKTSRQWGKSLFGTQLALNHAINNNKVLVAWFSPFISQTKKVMNELFEAIKPTGIVFRYNQTDRIITLINGSRIQFFGVDNPDSIRGISVDFAICDEAAFYKSDVFETIIRPTLLVKGKKCYLISTPKGKSNYFYRYYVQEDEAYLSCQSTWRENRFIQEEEIELARKTLPEYIYQQEYEGVFLDSEFQVFRNLEEVTILNQFGHLTGNYSAGLDLGRKDDYTVLTIFNGNGELVEIYRDRNKLWQTLLHDVVTRLKKYNCNVVVDATGVGDAVFEQLQKQYKKSEAFVITGGNKQSLIESLIIALENKEMFLPTEKLCKPLYDEFSIFEYQYTPSSRTIKYGAPSGAHDDIVLSVALANECRKNSKASSFHVRRV